MSDDPIIKPAFLPKDREGSIRMIAEVLYGRLEIVGLFHLIALEDGYEDVANIYKNEIEFIRNLLNMMECS